MGENMLLRCLAILAILYSILNSATATAQAYPNKPIRIVTSSVGSATDFSTRLILPGLSADLGQSLVVDNRPGGIIQGQIVSRAQPDGYTLLTAGSAFIWGPLFTPTPYDLIKDFAPIS